MFCIFCVYFPEKYFSFFQDLQPAWEFLLKKKKFHSIGCVCGESEQLARVISMQGTILPHISRSSLDLLRLKFPPHTPRKSPHSSKPPFCRYVYTYASLSLSRNSKSVISHPQRLRTHMSSHPKPLNCFHHKSRYLRSIYLGITPPPLLLHGGI